MIKVELHTHTRASYDVTTSYADIINACLAKKIDVLAVCDHNQIEGALRLHKLAPFKIIIGQEIMTISGEIIGLFLNKYISPKLSLTETINKIKQQGGLVYLPHPFDSTTRKTSLDSKEIIQNIIKIDIIEVHNGRTVNQSDNVKAKKFAQKYGKIQVVGSDAHTKYEYGRNYMLVNNFQTVGGFLASLSNAKKRKARIMYLPFLLTKWARFKKRHLLDQPQKIKLATRCDCCGGSNFSLVYKKRGKIGKKYFVSDDSYGVHFQIVRCMDCNLVFAFPREKKQTTLKKYKDFIDEEYESERESRKTGQKEILKRIEKHLRSSKGRLLDVGAATGAFVEMAKERGWDAYGVEPSKWASDLAREKFGLKVKTGTLSDVKYKKNSFNSIICIDVIEHVDSPREFLSQVFSLLKPGGVLCVVTPNKSSFVAKLLGESWWHVRPDHIYYFDYDTFMCLSRSMSLKLIERRGYKWTFSYDYWISRFKKSAPWLYNLFEIARRTPFLSVFTDRIYSINFHDSSELYFRKPK